MRGVRVCSAYLDALTTLLGLVLPLCGVALRLIGSAAAPAVLKAYRSY
jgi:hypothetical protein